MQENSTQVLPTVQLRQSGQSPWLDSLSREMLQSGKLRRMIREQGVLGVTSNPSIFQTAISQSQGAYDSDIRKWTLSGASALEIYDTLSISDIQDACDLFSEVHANTQGLDGFVSLEVLPNLAYSTKKTVAEALRLVKEVGRSNLMIKVPATCDGVAAVRKLVSMGVNVNVTLIFSVAQYKAVAEAYIQGISEFVRKGGDASKVQSVASVFVSRFDTLIDKKIQSLMDHASGAKRQQLQALLGKAGVVNSKLVYEEFTRLFTQPRFLKLQSDGVQVQRVLWGSTSSKNPQYSDLLYVESLVGNHTVNTMPQVTLDALLDHGTIRANTVENDLDQAHQTARLLSKEGFDLEAVGETLQTQGVQLFCQAFDDLMSTLEKARMQYVKGGVVKKKNAVMLPQYRFQLTAKDEARLKTQLDGFEKNGIVSKLVAQDPLIWKSDEPHKKVILNRLGWLKVHEWMLGKLYEIEQLRSEIVKEKIKDLVLLGMGGSSLAPEVMDLICRSGKGQPRFCIVDTTDPASLKSLLKKIQLKSTLFIVSSKSGGTIETLSQYHYLFSLVKASCGKKADADEIGRRFIAITDPGSSLESIARKNKFRACFLNPANIGGRYSALSLFGMVPAALMGLDVRAFLSQAKAVYERLAKAQAKASDIPEVVLGALLGTLAKAGKDKLTFIASPSVAPFGAWAEQLIAESTGKEKVGILPVDTEDIALVDEYGEDRVFVALKLKRDVWPAAVKAKMANLVKKGFNLVEITWTDESSLAAEFLSWEIMTAVSGVVLGINPFDEPNVTESKEITGRLLGELKKKKTIENPTRYFYAKRQIEWGLILKQVRKGSYISLLSYTPRTPAIQKAFSKMRRTLRKAYQVPVLMGFGPRYLHSIGQFYKGGTPSGLFVEFFVQDKTDIKVPEAHYTFSQLKRAQGLGDFEAIQNKGLPIIAIDLGSDVFSGLNLTEKQLANYLKDRA